jgi:hypothetical protein
VNLVTIQMAAGVFPSTYSFVRELNIHKFMALIFRTYSAVLSPNVQEQKDTHHGDLPTAQGRENTIYYLT